MKECQKSGLRLVRPATEEANANGGRQSSRVGEAIQKDDNMIRLVSGRRCRGFVAVDQDRYEERRVQYH
jgi:hypothetical protein